MTWDIATADEEWLIDLCHKKGLEGNRVIQLSNQIAVKYDVTAAEAATQEFASNTVDSNIVHIPRVYRFIQAKGLAPKGYLFMEYVPGQNLKVVDLETRKDLVPRIAQIAAHLSQIQGQSPGPVGGGEPHGYLWGDDAPHALVLCHLDLCRRNIILKADGSLCLVDWGSAGFYARLFELAVIPCMLPYDAPYEQPLLQEVENVMRLTNEEKRLTQLVHHVRAANLRYLFHEQPSFDYAAFMAKSIQ
ncbi:hypothetical protein AWENTII_003695 [Aspergillus wentii]